MSFIGVIGAIAKPILAPIFGLIDKAVVDKDEALKIKSELEGAVVEIQKVTLEGARDIVIAEAQGESWLQRNWRPMFMVFLMFFIGSSVIAGAFGYGAEVKAGWDAIPQPAWTLSQIGLGGYIGGRTVEKVTKTVTGKGVIQHAKDFINWKK